MEEDEPEHPDTPTDWDRRKSATRGTKNDSQGLSDLEDIIPVNQGRLHMYAVGKKVVCPSLAPLLILRVSRSAAGSFQLSFVQGCPTAGRDFPTDGRE
eukprot:766979-Hanusia_phi.AAC.1